VEGNRSLIEPGVAGLLFGDEAELCEQAERLAADPALRARLGAAGWEIVQRRYPPAREIEGYLEVYRPLTPVPAAGALGSPAFWDPAASRASAVPATLPPPARGPPPLPLSPGV